MKYKPYKIPEVFKIKGELSVFEHLTGQFDRKGRFVPMLLQEIARMGPAIDPELADELAKKGLENLMRGRSLSEDEETVPYKIELRPDSRHRIAWDALSEIDDIWWAVKRIGPLARTAPQYKKRAALTGFDDSKQGFELVKREYLEDDNLYEFSSPAQEKRDFTLKLLRKVFRDRVKFKTTKDQLLYLIWLIREQKEELAFDMSFTDTE